MTALADYWTNEYDWFKHQEQINAKFEHFAMTVPETPGWPHKVPLHYIHERSENDDALPLLLLHGWPSTSWEWEKVIHPLVSPQDPDFPGHHVVAPDLPGFGFSPAPQYAGFDPITIAGVMDTFMAELGYDRYGVVSTDLGWWIAMFMADVVPEGRMAGHFCDFFLVQSNATDLERYSNNQTTPEETRQIESSNAWYSKHTGYQHVQTQQPLAVGQAFSDSPVGFGGWIWHIMMSVSDSYPYTWDEIVTTSFVVFIQGTWGNLRYYTEFFKPEAMKWPKTEVPTGVSQWGMGDKESLFPDIADFNYIPREWLERTANVREVYRHEDGGHFPAISNPTQWVADVLDFFAKHI